MSINKVEVVIIVLVSTNFSKSWINFSKNFSKQFDIFQMFKDRLFSMLHTCFWNIENCQSCLFIPQGESVILTPQVSGNQKRVRASLETLRQIP